MPETPVRREVRNSRVAHCHQMTDELTKVETESAHAAQPQVVETGLFIQSHVPLLPDMAKLPGVGLVTSKPAR